MFSSALAGRVFKIVYVNSLALNNKRVHVPLSAYIGTIPARVFGNLSQNDNLL